MPKISIVVVSLSGAGGVEECLRALTGQTGGVESEIILVSPGDDDASEKVEERFPAVTVIRTGERLGIPKMRSLGISKAAGEFVAVTEDRCIPAANWLEEIIAAHESGYDVVGGAIENGSSDRLVNWAAYFCEYSQMMPPIAEGEVQQLAGNNVSFRREVLSRVDEAVRTGYWEYFLFRELNKLNIPMRSVPAIVVRKKKEFSFVYFLKQRYLFSRSFAGMRRNLIPASRSLFSAALSPVLPLLMTWRIARLVLSKKRHFGKFVLSLPFLSVFLLSYAAGEFAGYIFGEGDSTEKVE